MSYKPTKKALVYMRKMISQKSWEVNDKIPSLSSIADTLGISSSTVRKATRVLEDEGTIQNFGSLGFFVVSNLAIELKKQRKNKYYLGMLKNNIQIMEMLGNRGVKLGRYIMRYIPATKRVEALNIISGKVYNELISDLIEAAKTPVTLDALLKVYTQSPKTYQANRQKYDKQRKIQTVARIVSRHKKELGIHGE